MLNYYLKHLFACGHSSIPVEQEKEKSCLNFFLKKRGHAPNKTNKNKIPHPIQKYKISTKTKKKTPPNKNSL